MSGIYIKLNADDFKCLVSFGRLSIKSKDCAIKMILEDMDYVKMVEIIQVIEESKEFFQDKEKEVS